MLNNYYLSAALFFSVCIMLFIAYNSWIHRKIPTSLKISMIMLAASLYTIGYSHEVTLSDLLEIKACLRVEYLGIPFIPSLWLLLIIEYTGLHSVKKWFYGLLFIIPSITLMLHYTNDWHHLFYKDIYLDYSTGFPIVCLKKGIWYWVHITYSYLLLIYCTILLFIKFVKEGSLHRKQIIALGLGFFIPWVCNMIYLWNNKNIHIDLTPFGFVFSGILLTWAIHHYNLLRFTPVAYERIFESLSDGVIVLDFKNQIINFNESAVIIIPELSKITDNDYNFETVLQKYPIIKETLIHDVSGEIHFTITREGILKFYSLKLSLIYDKKCIVGKIIVLSDITVIEKSMENLTATSAQLAALNTLKDRLISIVVSDIREPLDMLINLSDIINKQEFNKGNNSLLIKEIQRHVKAIFLRVDNMLEYFQNKQFSIIYSPMEWKLSLLVEEAVKTIREKAEKKNIHITCDLEDNLSLFADKGMVDIVLRNLLTNAVKFTNRNGSIYISAQEENNFIIISVKDTGVGMKSEKIQLLFQDVECDPSIGTEGEMGIGLGLLLCRQIIKRNHGDIWVDSTFGEGSNFFISVPSSIERYIF
ncbi:MAG: histidine kinase N-terminal 7TM domain-containing protein [Anaerocolumna sp.]